VAVVCEHGLRGVSACRLLAEHGFSPLYNLSGGLESWPGPLHHGLEGSGQSPSPLAPARFLVENFDLLPKGLALDLAMGEGRNAIYLATRGFDVDGVDVDPEAVARARAKARRLGAPIRAVVGNVEDGTYIIPLETYDVIAVFNYLHRPLFNDIREGLKPGGVVIYQTFTTEQLRFGAGPRNPDHLLRPGELRQVFADWEILRYREYVEREGPGNPPRALAGVVARRPR
jgi:SAM-dependent methyltransferase